MLPWILARASTHSDGWLAALFGVGAAGVWLPGSLFLGTFVTEDLSCVAAGIFAAEGQIDLLTATVACTPRPPRPTSRPRTATGQHRPLDSFTGLPCVRVPHVAQLGRARACMRARSTREGRV